MSVREKVSRVASKMGKAPGTVSYLGTKERTESVVYITEYNAADFSRTELTDVPTIVKRKQSEMTSWINVIGINDAPYIEELGKAFGLNPLVLEDAINTEQRPKIDEYEDYIFAVFRMLYLSKEDEIVGEHVAMVLTENSVLVFQEVKEDVFNGVRNRIQSKLGRIRTHGEMSMSLMEMYMSNMSNKMNEVMKVLTIMASIFIPLTFIAGVYGMNFQHMPELQWENGYYYVWGLMIVLFLGMLIYFKKKDWI